MTHKRISLLKYLLAQLATPRLYIAHKTCSIFNWKAPFHISICCTTTPQTYRHLEKKERLRIFSIMVMDYYKLQSVSSAVTPEPWGGGVLFQIIERGRVR